MLFSRIPPQIEKILFFQTFTIRWVIWIVGTEFFELHLTLHKIEGLILIAQNTQFVEWNIFVYDIDGKKPATFPWHEITLVVNYGRIFRSLIVQQAIIIYTIIQQSKKMLSRIDGGPHPKRKHFLEAPRNRDFKI